MAKMKAVQVLQAGANFEIVKRKIPLPGSGHVRLRVQACGGCHSGVVIKGGLFPGITYPRVRGHEVAGVIDQVGASFAQWKKGQRDMRLTRRGRRARLSDKREAQNGNSGQDGLILRRLVLFDFLEAGSGSQPQESLSTPRSQRRSIRFQQFRPSADPLGLLGSRLRPKERIDDEIQECVSKQDQPAFLLEERDGSWRSDFRRRAAVHPRVRFRKG
jgi:hypothetical protein